MERAPAERKYSFQNTIVGRYSITGEPQPSSEQRVGLESIFRQLQQHERTRTRRESHLSPRTEPDPHLHVPSAGAAPSPHISLNRGRTESYIEELQRETNQLSYQRFERLGFSWNDELERMRGDQDAVLRGTLLDTPYDRTLNRGARPSYSGVFRPSTGETVAPPAAESPFRGKSIDKFWRLCGRLPLNAYCFLVILGIVGGSLNFAQDLLIEQLEKLRVSIESKISEYALQYLFYIAWGLVLTVTVAFLVEKISPQARGSGLPEMKVIIAGVKLQGYLSLRTLVAKIIGLTGVLAGGLSVGKEGPFVHAASVAAWQMLKLPFFKNWSYKRRLREQMLSAGVSVGVASTFGTPVGAVLFSIEVTSIYYMLSAYAKCMLAAVAATWFRAQFREANAFYVEIAGFPFSNWEYWLFALVGVFGAVLGSGFSMFVDRWIKFLRYMRTRNIRLFTNPYIHVGLVSLLTSLTFFPVGSYMRKKMTSQINDMLAPTGMCVGDSGAWCGYSVPLALSICFVLRFLFTALAITLPVPAGVFMPLLAMGATMGRLVGEIAKLIVPSVQNPGGYAIVGMAAMAAGGTRTLSSAVIVYEMTMSLNYMTPVMVATVIAYMLGNVLHRDIYTVLMDAKNLPYLPAFRFTRSKLAKDIMVTNPPALERKSTYSSIVRLLRKQPSTEAGVFSIVDSLENNYLVGTISREALEQMARQHLSAHGFVLNTDRLTLRTGLAYMAHNILAPLGLGPRLTGAGRNRPALSHNISAYPALLEDMRMQAAGDGVYQPVTTTLATLLGENDAHHDDAEDSGPATVDEAVGASPSMMQRVKSFLSKNPSPHSSGKDEESLGDNINIIMDKRAPTPTFRDKGHGVCLLFIARTESTFTTVSSTRPLVTPEQPKPAHTHVNRLMGMFTSSHSPSPAQSPLSRPQARGGIVFTEDAAALERAAALSSVSLPTLPSVALHPRSPEAGSSPATIHHAQTDPARSPYSSDRSRRSTETSLHQPDTKTSVTRQDDIAEEPESVALPPNVPESIAQYFDPGQNNGGTAPKSPASGSTATPSRRHASAPGYNFITGSLDETVDFFDPDSHYSLFVDFSPMQVVEHMPLVEVHFLFTMLKMPYVLVTRKGKLMGIITKETLIEYHFKQQDDNT